MRTQIKTLGPKEQKGFIIAFKIDSEEKHCITIDISYTSKLFTEKLNQELKAQDAQNINFSDIKNRALPAIINFETQTVT